MNDENRDAVDERGEMPEGDEAIPPLVRVMAVARWFLVVAMGGAAAASILYAAGYLGSPAVSSPLAKYYCPMHPAVVADRPGACPICGMDLVLREPTASVDAGATLPGLAPIVLSPERIQLVGMQTARAVRETIASDLRTTGYVVAPEKGVVRVHTRFAGWIERVEFSEVGKRVRRGQLLASIYSPEVYTAQIDFLNARRWAASRPATDGAAPATARHANGAPQIVIETRRRLELLGVAPDDLRAIEQSGSALRAVGVRAPASGHVTRKLAVQGVYVQPGTELFEIADLSTLWAIADVNERDVTRVAVGQRARISFAAYPGESFAGRVALVSPAMNAETRSLRVRLELPNPRQRLKPGMIADVVFELAAAPAVVVPLEGVVDTGDLQYVFLARPGGRFEPRRVRLGARTGSRVAVLEGIHEGDIVVTTANFLIDSESRLRSAIEGL